MSLYHVLMSIFTSIGGKTAIARVPDWIISSRFFFFDILGHLLKDGVSMRKKDSACQVIAHLVCIRDVIRFNKRPTCDQLIDEFFFSHTSFFR